MENKSTNDQNEPLITVKSQGGTKNPFDVTSIGFDTQKQYTVSEFNQALRSANKKWQDERWDESSFSYPKGDVIIITVENLHNDPCTYRINLTDADYNSIQDIVELSPTPIHASISTDEVIEKLNKAETSVQKQDISLKNNAAPSAIRAERVVNMAETKMECTGMVMLPEDSKAKAVATVTINDEFVIKGIKVFDGTNGLFVSMPSRRVGDSNEYQDVIFPITKAAREQLNSAVLETYGKLAESGLDMLPLEEKEPPEKSTSKITVTLHQINDEKTKAAGQIVIDDCIVVSGVKVRHGTNSEGVEKDFVSMPSYQTQTGDYNEYAHAVTKDCYDKINKAVLGTYEMLQKTEYKGVKLSELGEKGEVSTKYGMNNQFAAKLMTELDKAGVTYSAKVAESTSLTVKNADRATVDKVQKDLSAALTAAKKAEQQTAPKKTR